MTHPTGAAFLAVAMLVAGCGVRPATPGPALPRSAFVTVNGARLNYLDWGGRGLGMVFIHGLGDSPHALTGSPPSSATGS